MVTGVKDVTQRYEQVDHDNFIYGDKPTLSVYPFGDMTRSEVAKANNAERVFFLKPEDKRGDYVLDNDLADYLEKYSGCLITVEMHELEDIDWGD
ncbi:hypothetical protein EFT44_01580 [Leuconostoc falkenbergense]|uniref:hypothetical protein n=1 Tax=Leuconostoc falkenbergense TaxID=2766470 RepID=UPI0021AAD3F0|nr:hypothetical protein [Leuconostoc falkenbergense]MCT4410278.1 hypothetical protein [Leuconostoc falkenbergense]